MSVQVTYSLPASEIYLARTRAELKAFFDGFLVPSATTTTEGSVKKCASVAYTHWASYTTSDFLTIPIAVGGELTNYELPLKATFDELRTKVEAINDFIDDLRTKMQLAGLLQSGA